jgi:hypothetical protein
MLTIFSLHKMKMKMSILDWSGTWTTNICPIKESEGIQISSMLSQLLDKIVTLWTQGHD